MPTFTMVPVDKLQAPANPMREASFLEGMDELRASIHANGLQQPIGVRALTGGEYQILYGHRRSYAVTQLKWDFVPAMVYLENEGSDDVLMASENLQRTQVNPGEEAVMWKRLLPLDPEGTIGLAKRYHVSQGRIERLLAIEMGDPDVFRLMSDGKLSMEQAHEINKFPARGWRLQAIELCVKEGWSADRVRRWRRDQEQKGIDLHHEVAPEQFSMLELPKVTQGTDLCNIHNGQVPYAERRVWGVCDECQNTVIKGFEYVGQMLLLEETGFLPEYKKLLRKAERAAADNGDRTDVLQHDRGSGTGQG